VINENFLNQIVSLENTNMRAATSFSYGSKVKVKGQGQMSPNLIIYWQSDVHRKTYLID